MDWNIGKSLLYRCHFCCTMQFLTHAQHFSHHRLFLICCRWVQTGSLQATSHISSLSWNLEGTRLLTGGVTIQLWHERMSNKEEESARECGIPFEDDFLVFDHTMNECALLLSFFLSIQSAVTFEIGGSSAADPRTPTHEEESETGWECVWKCHTATPVHHMSFSPDGTLFATSGKSDRLVKVWYENKHCKYHQQCGHQSVSIVSIVSDNANANINSLQYYSRTKVWTPRISVRWHRMLAK